MKNKLISAIICAAAIVGGAFMQTSYAENVGDVIGTIYSTDITAYIDDMPIKSYNTGGRTVIPIEDLRDYGFEVEWNENSRELRAVISDRPAETPEPVIEKQVPGNAIGSIYYTDIRVFINGIESIQTYNIGGVTCIAIEELGVDVFADNRPKYSGYGMRYVYDDTSRTIRLYTLRTGDTLETAYGTAAIKKIEADYIKDNYVYLDDTSPDPLSHFIFSLPDMSDYININDLPPETGLTAKVENAVYSVKSSSNKEIGCRPYGASNGSNRNDCIVLCLSLPININGEFIDDENANCIMQLTSSDDNYDDLYVSADFLNRYTKRVFLGKVN